MPYVKPVQKTVRIASGQTKSDPVRINEKLVAGVLLPAAMTGTTLTFEGALTRDGTYGAVVDSAGATVSITFAASQAVGLSGSEADALSAWPWLKLVSNASEAADRDFGVSLK